MDTLAHVLSLLFVVGLLGWLRHKDRHAKVTLERYRTFVDEVSEGHWDWHRGTGVDWMSKRYHEVLGYSEIPPHVDGWKELIHPDFREMAAAAFLRTIEDGIPFHVVYKMVKADGSHVWHLDRGVPFFDAAGQVVRIMGTHTDVTDLIEAQESLVALYEKQTALYEEQRRLRTDIEDFVFAAAHDLKEPLRGARTSLEMALSDGVDDEVRKFFAKNATLECDKGDQLVADLLRYGLAGNQEPLVVLDVAEELAKVEQYVSTRSSTAKVTFDIGTPRITATPSFLWRSLENLISNSLKFAGDEDPEIHVYVGLEEDSAVVRVTDNGIGIAKEHLERALQPFKQLNSSTEYGGTGLGLAIVGKVCRMHGGSLDISSPGPGLGTTVTLRISQ